MRSVLVIVTLLALAAPLTAEEKVAIARLAPAGADFVVAVRCGEGALVPMVAQLSVTPRAAMAVMGEEAARMAASGIDAARVTFLARVGNRNNPSGSVTLVRGGLDPAKLATHGVALIDNAVAVIGAKDAVAAVEAAAKGGGEGGVLADLARVLQRRNGLVALGRFPKGLAGELPTSLGKLLPDADWQRVRSAALSLFEKDGEVVLGFESADAAGEARANLQKGLKAWVDDAARVAGEAAKSARPVDAFASLDATVMGARVHNAALADLVGLLAVEQRAADLVVRVERARVDYATTPAALAGSLASAYLPELEMHRRRANFRACYATQKTLVGALEMYALDKNLKTPPLTPELFEELKKGGYLASAAFDDPGQGPGTRSHYELVANVNGIRCKVHGDVEGNPGTEPIPPQLEPALPPAAKARDDLRSCRANQKTLTGAIEMYKLDKNVQQIATLDPALLAAIKEGGYIATIPDDPGEGKGTSGSYYLQQDGTVACRVHGDVEGKVKGSKTVE